MRVTILDTSNDKVHCKEKISTFQLRENNWSCDCNRAEDSRDDVDSTCQSKRYLVIAAQPDLEDDYEVSLVELNEGYPAELLRKYNLT